MPATHANTRCSAMSRRDDDLRVRPGRIRDGNRGARKSESYVAQVMRAAKTAGHTGSRFGGGGRAAPARHCLSLCRLLLPRGEDPHGRRAWPPDPACMRAHEPDNGTPVDHPFATAFTAGRLDRPRRHPDRHPLGKFVTGANDRYTKLTEAREMVVEDPAILNSTPIIRTRIPV